MNLADSGKFLIIAGTVIIIVGLLMVVSDKLPLGRLPGDVAFGGERFRVHIPIATSILLSVVLTVALTIAVNFFGRK